MSNLRQRLRISIKLLLVLGVFSVSAVFINSLFLHLPKPIQTQLKNSPVSIDLTSLSRGQIKTVRWQSNEVAVLYRQFPEKINNYGGVINTAKEQFYDSINPITRSLKMKYFVYINQGDSSYCPLFYRAGRLTDTCTSTSFDEAGRALTSSAFTIEVPPHYFIDNRLIVGRWKAQNL